MHEHLCCTVRLCCGMKSLLMWLILTYKIYKIICFSLVSFQVLTSEEDAGGLTLVRVLSVCALTPTTHQLLFNLPLGWQITDVCCLAQNALVPSGLRLVDLGDVLK